jgi:hypothetical protein
MRKNKDKFAKVALRLKIGYADYNEPELLGQARTTDSLPQITNWPVIQPLEV